VDHVVDVLDERLDDPLCGAERLNAPAIELNLHHGTPPRDVWTAGGAGQRTPRARVAARLGELSWKPVEAPGVEPGVRV